MDRLRRAPWTNSSPHAYLPQVAIPVPMFSTLSVNTRTESDRINSIVSLTSHILIIGILGKTLHGVGEIEDSELIVQLGIIRDHQRYATCGSNTGHSNWVPRQVVGVLHQQAAGCQPPDGASVVSTLAITQLCEPDGVRAIVPGLVQPRL